MAKEWILDKNHLNYWLRQLRKERDLIAPSREASGDIVYKSVDRIHEIALDCPAILPTIKEFLTPQCERMLRLSGDNVTDLRDNRGRVLFGVRSCDVSALRLLDRFYSGAFIDPYYESRRKNTLFISIGCNNPDPACFCIGLGTGPFLEAGFDIQLTDLGDRYFVQADSKEGIKVIKRFSFLFTKPRKPDYEDQYEAWLSSKARFHKRINLENARQLIKSGVVKDEFWQKVTDRCFECGGCVYDCPMCTCYNVIDRQYDGDVERFKLWDACLFKGFTRMAGGVVPAAKRILRTKRWFYHKLVYQPEQFGLFGCVGCGRCTLTCPGIIDMAAVTMKMKGIEINGNEDETETE